MSRHDDGETTHEVYDAARDDWIEVAVTYEITPGEEPRGLSGPPEHYDPGSGPEVHITATTFEGQPYGLSDEDIEKVENWIVTHHEFQPDEPPERDYYDD